MDVPNNKNKVTQHEMKNFVNNQIDRALALTRDVVKANQLKYDELDIDGKEYFDRSINAPQKVNKQH